MRMLVTRAFKGIEPGELEIVNVDATVNCGFPLRLDRGYAFSRRAVLTARSKSAPARPMLSNWSALLGTKHSTS